jgi:hypothetical protein
MAKIHPVEKRLSEVLGLKRSSKDSDKSFQKKLHEAAIECDDPTWKKLGDEAQEWVNAVSAYYDKKDGKKGRTTWPADYDDTDQEDPKPKGKSEPKEDSADDEADGERPSKSDEEDEDEDMATSKKGGKAPAKKSTKPASKAPAKKAASGDGYKGHRAGSTKGDVHQAYDKQGADAAMKLAVKKGIKESSARSWIGSWGGFGKKEKK